MSITLTKNQIVEVIISTYLRIVSFQSLAILRRNVHIKKNIATATSMICMIKDTNDIIPKNHSNIRAITANIYPMILDIFILSFFTWFFLTKCIDFFVCKFLLKFDDLLAEVIFSRSSLLLGLEHTFARSELYLDRCPIKSKYFTDLVLYIADIREVEVIRIIN